MKRKLILSLSCAAALLLQGCADSFDKKYSEKVLADGVPGVRNIDDQKQPAFTRYNTAFLGRQVVYSSKQQQLLARPVKFHSQVPVPLRMVLSAITAQTGSSFLINDSVPGGDGGDHDRPKAASGAMLRDNSVNFSGSFEEFMRYLSALYDVSVSLTDDNILQVDLYKTWVLKLDYFGESSYDTGLDMTGNAATSDGGMKGKLESKFDSTFWGDVESLAQKYVSSGVFNIFREAGVMTFSGRPSEYRLLSRLLQDYRRDNNKQFVVTYKVFVLNRDKVRKLGGEASLNFATTSGSIINLNSLVSPAPGVDGGIGLAGKFGNMDVAAKLEALYQLTGSKVLESGTVVTRNNMPVPLNLTKSRNYVSSITNSFTGTIGIQNSAISTDTIVTGTSMLLTPRVLSDGRVQVTSAYTRKDMDGEPEVFGQDGNQVQLPKISTTELLNTVDVPAGSLVTVARYEMAMDGDSRNLHLLGGSRGRSDSTQTVVMIVGVDYYNNPFRAGQ